MEGRGGLQGVAGAGIGEAMPDDNDAAGMNLLSHNPWIVAAELQVGETFSVVRTSDDRRWACVVRQDGTEVYLDAAKYYADVDRLSAPQ